MARFTPIYSEFVTRLVEVERLRKLALAKERVAPIAEKDDINALCRGSIVLLSGHLEAYVRELGQHALDCFFTKKVDRQNVSSKFFYHISKQKLIEIEQTVDVEKKGDKVFDFLSGDIDYWSRSGPFPKSIDPDKFSRGFANPGYKKICRYFSRFGYQNYNAEVSQRLSGKSTVTINMVNHLVDTRNKIAHGDPAATKTPLDIEQMTKIIKDFASSTDGVFADWCKNNFCAIR